LANAFTDERFTLIENFRFNKRFAFLRIEKCGRILADLGVSSHQFDVPERVFLLGLIELDMRMSQKNDLNAYKVVNEYDEAKKRSVL
jgi:16S rRNA (cytosine1402-N4)-methyltransferase